MKMFVKKFLMIFILAAVAATSAALISNKIIRDSAYAAGDDDYKALDSFMQALSLVENAYVEPVEKKTAIYGAIKGMLQDLDPHSTFFTPEKYKAFQVETKGSFGGLGISIGMRDNMLTIISPIEDTPAAKAGVKSGDVIVKINNEPTNGFSLDEAVDRMRGEPGTKVQITVIRKGEQEPVVFDLERAIIKIKSIKSATENNIGYIRFTQFQDGSANDMSKALAEFDKAGVKGLIIDLRNNGGGLLTEAINSASLFLPTDKTVVYTKDKSQKENHYKTKRFTYRDNDRPIVVIVNEGSASASEILAGALQDYGRAVIVGTTTFGKASVQSIIEMKDGSAIKLTTARYYTPLGRSIQGVGIEPDVAVAAGKIEFVDNPYAIKEKDLTKHLKGENEKGKTDSKSKQVQSDNVSVLPDESDLQYLSAMQVLKGMMTFNKKTK